MCSYNDKIWIKPVMHASSANAHPLMFSNAYIMNAIVFVCNSCSTMDCVIQIPWHTGTEVVALYKFPGNSPEDLPFRRGEILTIVDAGMVRKTMFISAHM